MFFLDVALEEFLKFNKIKNITTNIEEIRKALATSDLLKVSEDGKQVKRITEISKNDAADECTIYVEGLPKTATHDYMKEIFQRYGEVTYVSLPRYKHSRKIKEFGFVEFENTAAMEKALNAFGKRGSVLQYQTYDPSALQSVTSYNLEQKQKDEESEKETEPEDEELQPKKKIRLEENAEATKAEEAVIEEEKIQDEQPIDKQDDDEARKKRKKKKKSAKPIDEKIFDQLRVIRKIDWKRLRFV